MFVHSCRQAFAKQAGNGLAYPGYHRADHPLFFAGEITQHIADDVGIAWFCVICSRFGPADADPYADEIPASQFADDGVNPVVAAGATPLAEPDFAQRQVEVVVDDNQVFRA